MSVFVSIEYLLVLDVLAVLRIVIDRRWESDRIGHKGQIWPHLERPTAEKLFSFREGGPDQELGHKTPLEALASDTRYIGSCFALAMVSPFQ